MLCTSPTRRAFEGTVAMQLGVQLFARLCSLDPSTEAADYQVAAADQSSEAWDIEGLWSDILQAEEARSKDKDTPAISPPVVPKVSPSAISPSDLAMVRALFDDDATSPNTHTRHRHRHRHRRHPHAERRAAEDRRETEEGRRRRRHAGSEGGGVGVDTRREEVVLGRRRLSADRALMIHEAPSPSPSRQPEPEPEPETRTETRGRTRCCAGCCSPRARRSWARRAAPSCGATCSAGWRPRSRWAAPSMSRCSDPDPDPNLTRTRTRTL